MPVDQEIGDVSRAMMALADDLRARGQVGFASRCDLLSQRLSKALHEMMAETQPITLKR